MGLFKSTFEKIRGGLARTREGLVGSLRSILSGRRLDEDLIDEIEMHLLTADVGVTTTTALVDELRTAYREKRIAEGDDVLPFLKERLKTRWADVDRGLAVAETGPTVILVAGVNGVGKTTSVAKIARSLLDDGRTVLLAAADTFRAGAVRQLMIWGERLGIDVVTGAAGADPASVAFSAIDAAIARGVDVLLIDTAGRLHNDPALMRELTKIRDIVARKVPGAPHEVLLVLDATQGQNALNQARDFQRAVDVTGIFLAKLDGTAKGGIVLSIRDALGIPVKLVGVGETVEDVEPFEPETFVEAMFAS